MAVENRNWVHALQPTFSNSFVTLPVLTRASCTIKCLLWVRIIRLINTGHGLEISEYAGHLIQQRYFSIIYSIIVIERNEECE